MDKTRQIGAFSLVTLLALAMRLSGLDRESLFMDELLQVAYYDFPLSTILSNAALQQQPPLDYWIGWIFHGINPSDFSVRLPAALFGSGAVALLMVLVLRLAGFAPALAAGIFLALSPFHLYFSQEARPYAIAIFFCLALLLVIERFLNEKPLKIWHWALLWLLSTLFLMTRALAPLVTVTVLTGLLFLMGLWSQGANRRRLWQMVGVLILSLLIYLPYFIKIMAVSGRYLQKDNAGGLISELLRGLARFDVLSLWKSYLVQMDPLGLILFPLLLVAPFIACRRTPFWWLLLATLVGALSLHLFIFSAKADHYFRPPYPVYLLPLALPLLACAVADLWQRLASREELRRLLFAAGLLITSAALAHGAIQYKTSDHKTDWRGLVRHLAATDDENAVLFFHAMAGMDRWQPGFLGANRYYRGQAPYASLFTLILDPSTHLAQRPVVVVLFQWHNLFITPNSPFPIIPIPPASPSLDYGPLRQDPALQVTEFTNLSVLRVQESQGPMAGDLLTIVEHLLQWAPPHPSNVESHLIAASLSHSLSLPQWRTHADMALNLAPGEIRGIVQRMVDEIAAREVVRPSQKRDSTTGPRSGP